MELHEAYQAFNPSSARYRKISLEGATVLGLINGYPNPKLFPKGMLV